ncbi:MAG: exonuclease domain-containing protein [Anaerolineae bacterium]
MFGFEERRPSEVPIVVLDTETTGLFPAMGHRVVEIGAIRLENWRAVAEMSQLIQPGRKMDPKASAVNGITDADLIGKPTFAEVSEELLALTEGALLVAHNAVFDAGFLGMEFYIQAFTTQQSLAELPMPNPWLCTLLLARRHFYFGRNNLGYIARQLGVRIGRAHRALNDVYMTAEVLKRMVRQLKKRQGLETVGDLLHAQGEPIYVPPPAQIPLPDLIADALSLGRRVRILYMSQSGETTRIITPNYPTLHRGVSYLVAHCHLRNEQRTFRMDRIFSAELLPEV